jgi:hypothetical protein
MTSYASLGERRDGERVARSVCVTGRLLSNPSMWSAENDPTFDINDTTPEVRQD